MAQMPDAIILRKTEETKTGVTYCMADVKTNRDLLRAMTDEEFADWLYNTVDDFPPWCDESRGHHGEPYGCEKCMVDWLKEEADE